MPLEPNFLIIITLVLIFIILQLIVGIFLLYKMIKTKLYNLLPLILFFLINSLLLLNLPYLFFHIIAHLPSICIIIFTKYTFYRDRKSAFKIVLGIVIVLKIADFILKLYIPFSFPMRIEIRSTEIPYYYLYLSIMAGIILISYIWLGYASLNTYKSLKNQSIEPWIKKRYLILGISSVLLSLNGVIMLFMPWTRKGFEDPLAFTIGILIFTVTIIFSAGSVIGWMMPQKLKKYFNRNFQPIPEVDLSEKELMEKIKKELSEGFDHGNN